MRKNCKEIDGRVIAGYLHFRIPFRHQYKVQIKKLFFFFTLFFFIRFLID